MELDRTWRIGRTRSCFMWNITTAAVIRSAVRTDHAQHVTSKPHADASAAGVTRAGGPQSVCALPAVRAYNKAHARPTCRVLPTGSVEARRCTRSSFASFAGECPPRCISASLALWPRKLVSLRHASTHRCLPAPCDLNPASIHLSSRPSPGDAYRALPRAYNTAPHEASTASFHVKHRSSTRPARAHATPRSRRSRFGRHSPESAPSSGAREAHARDVSAHCSRQIHMFHVKHRFPS